MAVPVISSALQDNVDAILARAQALYDDGTFRESIELLMPVDSALRSQPGRPNQHVNVKLLLALSHIALGERDDARSLFSELYALDPGYSLDKRRFTPEAILLFEEARSAPGKVTCQKVCSDADRLLESGDGEGLLRLVQGTASECACLEATAKDAASYFYQRGEEARKDGDFGGALRDFRISARLHPEHESAGSAIKASQEQLRLAAERTLLQWRAEMDARRFALAAATYRQLESANIEGTATQALENIHASYRQRLSPIIESWHRACSMGDAVMVERARRQAEELLPDPTVGEDLLAEISACTAKAPG